MRTQQRLLEQQVTATLMSFSPKHKTELADKANPTKLNPAHTPSPPKLEIVDSKASRVEALLRAKQEKKDAIVRAKAEERERAEEERRAKESKKSVKLGAHLAQMKELKRCCGSQYAPPPPTCTCPAPSLISFPLSSSPHLLPLPTSSAPVAAGPQNGVEETGKEAPSAEAVPTGLVRYAAAGARV